MQKIDTKLQWDNPSSPKEEHSKNLASPGAKEEDTQTIETRRFAD